MKCYFTSRVGWLDKCKKTWQFGEMARWTCKVSRSGESIRVTLPKSLVREAGWRYVNIVRLEITKDLDIRMRGFVDGESIKSEGETDRAGVD